jgi:hypothetical protein
MSSLTGEQRAAARALTDLMVQIRVVGYYPRLAARTPVREICRIAAGAGSAILAAGATREPARRTAFAELVQRWQRVPTDAAPAAIASGPAMFRYAGYAEPHADYDVHREGSAVLIAAVPDADPAAPWCLASEEIAGPTRFRITTASFDKVQHVHRDADTLTIGDSLAVQTQ